MLGKGWDSNTITMEHMLSIPSANLLHSYGKWPMENGDLYVTW